VVDERAYKIESPANTLQEPHKSFQLLHFVNLKMQLYRLHIFLTLLVGVSYGQTELSVEDGKRILQYHNMLRGVVEPTASNMKKMVSLVPMFFDNVTF